MRPLAVVAFLLVQSSSLAFAQSKGPETEADAAFMQGATLVQKSQWAEALAAFERAYELRPHAVTTYNVAACERAMGRYTRAFRTFARALDENAAAGGKALPPVLASDAKGYLGELDRLLVRLSLVVTPEGSRVTVDGRPLEAIPKGAEYVAGIRPPGVGDPSPRGPFVVLLDPGMHVLTFARPGFEDVVLRRSFPPGNAVAQRIELTQLPAQIHISSTQPRAIVRVDGTDVGPAPVDVLRPAGSYKVVVKYPGFEPYEARVNLRAGEQTDLRASLVESSPSIFSRWWFWTGAAILVTGAVVGTYAIVRPDNREPVGGGSLGWGVVGP
ncbi:PEGA domain-containing protein [Pendulispora rubella]|uniref:PEGA domain-containing protein n=1 Tax=Pendulispora rubella TaxID=2741070 RepID=A0ABZ2LFP8_9BACT